MKKKLLIYVLPFMLAFYSAHAYASDTPMHSVVITVTNIINQNGKIQIGLYNSPEKFSNIETSFRGVAIDIESEKKLTYVFKDIPTGVYAVSVFFMMKTATAFSIKKTYSEYLKRVMVSAIISDRSSEEQILRNHNLSLRLTPT